MKSHKEIKEEESSRLNVELERLTKDKLSLQEDYEKRLAQFDEQIERTKLKAEAMEKLKVKDI